MSRISGSGGGGASAVADAAGGATGLNGSAGGAASGGSAGGESRTEQALDRMRSIMDGGRDDAPRGGSKAGGNGAPARSGRAETKTDDEETGGGAGETPPEDDETPTAEDETETEAGGEASGGDDRGTGGGRGTDAEMADAGKPLDAQSLTQLRDMIARLGTEPNDKGGNAAAAGGADNDAGAAKPEAGGTGKPAAAAEGDPGVGKAWDEAVAKMDADGYGSVGAALKAMRDEMRSLIEERTGALNKGFEPIVRDHQARASAMQAEQRSRYVSDVHGYIDRLSASGHEELYGKSAQAATEEQAERREAVHRLASNLQRLHGGPGKLPASKAMMMAHRMSITDQGRSEAVEQVKREARERTGQRTASPGRSSGGAPRAKTEDEAKATIRGILRRR